MEGKLLVDRRVTDLENGKITIVLTAREVEVGQEFHSVFTYGVEWHVKRDESAAGWAEPLQSPEVVEAFLRGLQAGAALMQGPHLNLPVIDRVSGRPCPLPDV